MDDNAPLRRISAFVLTGPLVGNTSAGRDTLRQRDFPRHTDAPASSEVAISVCIIRSGTGPIEPPMTPRPRPVLPGWAVRSDHP
jgi:hypothetical protein